MQSYCLPLPAFSLPHNNSETSWPISTKFVREKEDFVLKKKKIKWEPCREGTSWEL